MIHSIEHENDPRLEPYRSVGNPRWLEEHGLFVAEGRLVVERTIAHGGYGIESILVTPTGLQALERILPSSASVYVAAQDIVTGVTGFNFHRGCLALVQRPSEQQSLTAFADARRLVVLEGVGNPDNVGGIFRSAAAFGADGVVLDPSSGDPLYRKAVRTSMGAVLRVPFTRLDEWPTGLRALKDFEITIAALTPSGSMTLDEFAPIASRGRVALLAGAEGSGLSASALSESHVMVRIPVDARSDSLNVVVAASIALERLRLTA